MFKNSFSILAVLSILNLIIGGIIYGVSFFFMTLLYNYQMSNASDTSGAYAIFLFLAFYPFILIPIFLISQNTAYFFLVNKFNAKRINAIFSTFVNSFVSFFSGGLIIIVVIAFGVFGFINDLIKYQNTGIDVEIIESNFETTDEVNPNVGFDSQEIILLDFNFNISIDSDQISSYSVIASFVNTSRTYLTNPIEKNLNFGNGDGVIGRIADGEEEKTFFVTGELSRYYILCQYNPKNKNYLNIKLNPQNDGGFKQFNIYEELDKELLDKINDVYESETEENDKKGSDKVKCR